MGPDAYPGSTTDAEALAAAQQTATTMPAIEQQPMPDTSEHTPEQPSDLEAAQARVAELEQLAAAQRRVAELEAQVANHDAELAAVQAAAPPELVVPEVGDHIEFHSERGIQRGTVREVTKVNLTNKPYDEPTTPACVVVWADGEVSGPIPVTEQLVTV